MDNGILYYLSGGKEPVVVRDNIARDDIIKAALEYLWTQEVIIGDPGYWRSWGENTVILDYGSWYNFFKWEAKK